MRRRHKSPGPRRPYRRPQTRHHRNLRRRRSAWAIAAIGLRHARPSNSVDKIVGPGKHLRPNLAKKELYGIVDIDSFAGPSEVIVLADDSASPRQVAAELLAQAEHAPGSCLLITASLDLAEDVQNLKLNYTAQKNFLAK